MTTSILLLLAGVVLAWFGGSLFVDGAVGLATLGAVAGGGDRGDGGGVWHVVARIDGGDSGGGGRGAADLPGGCGGQQCGEHRAGAGPGAVVSGMKAEDAGVRRDWAWALAVPFIMAAVLWDGWFSRVDALFLMGLFAVWLTVVVRHARRHRARNQGGSDRGGPGVTVENRGCRWWRGWDCSSLRHNLWCDGGKGVALALGWSPFIVGAVVVAVATGTPELATTIISRLRGHHDVGTGKHPGQQCLQRAVHCVAGRADSYRMPVKPPELMPSLVFGVVTTLMILPGRGGALGRWRGFVLLAVYALYIAMTLSASEL